MEFPAYFIAVKQSRRNRIQTSEVRFLRSVKGCTRFDRFRMLALTRYKHLAAVCDNVRMCFANYSHIT